VTLIDGYLALAVLAGLVFNATLSWWWADPLAGLVIVFYGAREGWAALREAHSLAGTTAGTPAPGRGGSC
jgi:divalent metal cation (Fe/Co/Zn/Cd) transporter